MWKKFTIVNRSHVQRLLLQVGLFPIVRDSICIAIILMSDLIIDHLMIVLQLVCSGNLFAHKCFLFRYLQGISWSVCRWTIWEKNLTTTVSCFFVNVFFPFSVYQSGFLSITSILIWNRLFLSARIIFFIFFFSA